PESTSASVAPDSGEDAASDATADSGDGSADPADSASDEGQLPDVTGMSSVEARHYLEALGFTNITLYDDDHSWIGAKPEHCTVREQDPQGGRQVPLDLEIKLGYYKDPWADPGAQCA